MVLTCNHRSFSGSAFRPQAARRPVTFLAKAEHFAGRGQRGPATASLMRTMGAIPAAALGGWRPRARTLTESVTAAIGEHSGQDYVDAYTPRRPAGEAER